MTYDELKAAYQAMQALCTQAAEALQENIDLLVESSTNRITGLLDDDVDLLAIESDTDLVARLRAAAMPVMRAQPAPAQETIVQTFTGLPLRKLRELLAGGWAVNGVSFERTEEDGTARRGAITTGGMVLWWNQAPAAQPAPVQEPVACLSETQAKAILDLALDLEKTGRLVALTEGQERSDFVARNRNIQCALEAVLRSATTPPEEPDRSWEADLAQAYREELDRLSQRNFELRMENAKLKATPPAAQPAVPLPRERVKEILSEEGFDRANVQARTDFITGFRAAEAAHGITAAPEKGQP